MFGFGQWHIGHNHSDIVGSARIERGRHQGVHGFLSWLLLRLRPTSLVIATRMEPVVMTFSSSYACA